MDNCCSVNFILLDPILNYESFQLRLNLDFSVFAKAGKELPYKKNECFLSIKGEKKSLLLCFQLHCHKETYLIA